MASTNGTARPRSRGPRSRIGGAALAFVAIGLLAACGNGQAATAQPANAVVERIETSDGVTLDARLFSARNTRLAIFLHGYGGDQSVWFPLARELAASDRASALTLDFRGYGASEGKQSTGDELVGDVLAAVDFAHGRGFRSIVLVGASMGGTAAIIAAARGSAIDGVIALSAPAQFGGIDAVQALADRKPTLVDRKPALGLIAAHDDVSAVDSMQMLQKQAQLSRRYANEVEGEAHGAALLTSSAAGMVRRTVDALLTEFWKAP